VNTALLKLHTVRGTSPREVPRRNTPAVLISTRYILYMKDSRWCISHKYILISSVACFLTYFTWRLIAALNVGHLKAVVQGHGNTQKILCTVRYYLYIIHMCKIFPTSLGLL
jgi:hypothetical protein